MDGEYTDRQMDKKIVTVALPSKAVVKGIYASNLSKHLRGCFSSLEIPGSEGNVNDINACLVIQKYESISYCGASEGQERV